MTSMQAYDAHSLHVLCPDLCNRRRASFACSSQVPGKKITSYSAFCSLLDVISFASMPNTIFITSYGWVVSNLNDLSDALRKVALETSQKPVGRALFHDTKQTGLQLYTPCWFGLVVHICFVGIKLMGLLCTPDVRIAYTVPTLQRRLAQSVM